VKYCSLTFFIVLFLPAFSLSGQNVSVKGTVTDSTDHSPLPGATVQLNETKGKAAYAVITGNKGDFLLSNVKPRTNYQIIIKYLGYETYQKPLRINISNIDLHEITLKEEANKINEVEVTGKAVRAIQKEDTLQLNAGAYQVNPDANAEDLVKKMPGITVENGQVKAQGEDVQRVYVDGRPFFDQDPTLTLRSLPAEIVDKIQVFDEQSEQARFTGFNDGQTSKTINVITRTNMRNGQFGKIYAGYGDPEKYYAGGNINVFKNQSRLSIIGLSNNINQQNFSSQDLIGLTGSSQRRGGGGFRGGMRSGGGAGPPGGMSYRGRGDIGNFLVGQQPGIATTHAIGLNYSDKWGNKINVSGSYFFNFSDNVSSQLTTQDYFTTNETSSVYKESDNSESTNANHRFNFRFDYNIDSLNSLMIRPRLSFQQNNSSSAILGQSLEDNVLLSQSNNKNLSDIQALNFSNDMLLMHRFMHPGRTISLNVTAGVNTRGGNSKRFAENSYDLDNLPVWDSLDQQTDMPAGGYSITSRLAYTEPVGKNGQLQMNYGISGSWNGSDRRTFDFNNSTSHYDVLDTLLTNTFNNKYITHQLGPGYRYRKDKLMFTIGVNYEHAALHNSQEFPLHSLLNQTFNSIQPSAMLMYNISQSKNLRLFFRTNSNPPSIDQLQNVLDNSNPLQLSSGNPDLHQAYQQNLFLRYSSTNAQKTSTLFCMLGFSNVKDYITNSYFMATTDTIFPGDILVRQGTQFSQPVNMDGYWNFRLFTAYGFPLSIVKSNLNFNTSYIFTKTPGMINGTKSFSNNHALGLGLVLSSNISKNIDFTVSTNNNYNIARSSIQENLNNNYFSHLSNLTLNLIFWKGVLFQSNVSYQLYKGLSEGYNTEYLLWNLSVGKKLFKNQRGELKISVFDVLNQNKNVIRDVTELYTEDTQTNVLQRYAILTFTYNLRNFNRSDAEERESPERSRGNFPFFP
jgi:hypothetical protein